MNDLDILKMYLLSKVNFLDQGFLKLEHYRQTDATEHITMPHTQVIITMRSK